MTETILARRPSSPGGAADVVHVMCLMQAAFLLLGALGELLLMGGSPFYLALPVAKVVLLAILAAKVTAGRPWAMITLIVVQGVTLVGLWVQLAAGLLAWVDFTVNLVVLITNLAMPVVVIVLCGRLLARRVPAAVGGEGPGARGPEARGPGAWGSDARAPDLTVPQDPYAPAPLVTSVLP